MSLISSTATDVTFRSRLRGFDPDEVRAFIGNLAGDYERAVRDRRLLAKEQPEPQRISDDNDG